MINRVSFGGIYMIKFPKTYGEADVKAKHDSLQKCIEDNNYFYMDSQMRRGIEPVKPNQSTNDILLLTNLDNPTQIHNALSSVDNKLADQYLDKTKVYLTLDETV